MSDSDPKTRSAAAPMPATPDRVSPPWWCRHRRPDYPPPTGCRRTWIPIFGYLDADDDHRARVDRFSEGPMIVLALLVLPVLGLEFLLTHVYRLFAVIPNVDRYLQGLAARDPEFAHAALVYEALNFAVTVALVFIWLAFLVEFVVKITIAPSRAQYAARNWLDIVIILLPMLRPLRGIRALRALRLTRVLRVFTLRGVAVKLVRSAIALALGAQFARRLQSRLKKEAEERLAAPDYTKWSKASLIAEIKRLNQRIGELEKDRERRGRT